MNSSKLTACDNWISIGGREEGIWALTAVAQLTGCHTAKQSRYLPGLWVQSLVRASTRGK